VDWNSLIASNTPLLWIRIFIFTLELIHQSLHVRHGLKMLIDIQIMGLSKFRIQPVHPLDPLASWGQQEDASRGQLPVAFPIVFIPL